MASIIQDFIPSPTSQEFFKEWIIATKRKVAELITDWTDYGKFTSHIIHTDDSVIAYVAKGLKLEAWNAEYYSLDTVLYHRFHDRIPGTGNAVFLHRIRVAFENENNFYGLHAEMSHLLITNCDLRVLTTYPDGDLGHTEKQMRYLHGLISNNPYCHQISEKENFLLIFGYNHKGLSWEGYVYKTNGWLKLIPGVRENH